MLDSEIVFLRESKNLDFGRRPFFFRIEGEFRIVKMKVETVLRFSDEIQTICYFQSRIYTVHTTKDILAPDYGNKYDTNKQTSKQKVASSFYFIIDDFVFILIR